MKILNNDDEDSDYNTFLKEALFGLITHSLSTVMQGITYADLDVMFKL